jgi:hypothetical protein
MVEVKGEKVKGKRAKEKIYEFNTTDIFFFQFRNRIHT